jgi:hypothetical protein
MGFIAFALVVGGIWLMVMSGGPVGLVASAAKWLTEMADRLSEWWKEQASGPPHSGAVSSPARPTQASSAFAQRQAIRCPCGSTHHVRPGESIRCWQCNRLLRAPSSTRPPATQQRTPSPQPRADRDEPVAGTRSADPTERTKRPTGPPQASCVYCEEGVAAVGGPCDRCGKTARYCPTCFLLIPQGDRDCPNCDERPRGRHGDLSQPAGWVRKRCLSCMETYMEIDGHACPSLDR